MLWPEYIAALTKHVEDAATAAGERVEDLVVSYVDTGGGGQPSGTELRVEIERHEDVDGRESVFVAIWGWN